MSKSSSDEYLGLGVQPVINPFWAFVLYLIAVHYFCFSLWPLAWWHICDFFDLFYRLTGQEFLDIASGISKSTGIMLFFFFFAAGYNTTNVGATQQINEPLPVYKRIVKALNGSTVLTGLVWLIPYVFFCTFLKNTDEEYLDGTQLPNLDLLSSEIFLDFSTYYDKLASHGVYSAYFPFSPIYIIAFSSWYFFVSIYFMIDNRLPFFIMVESLNKHFWQKIKLIPVLTKRR